MSFKVGDLGIINSNEPCFSPYKLGEIVTVLKIKGEALTVENNRGDIYKIRDVDLDKYQDLPIGIKLSFYLDPALCDCGGYKTYGSMDPVHHSKSLPCSSLLVK